MSLVDSMRKKELSNSLIMGMFFKCIGLLMFIFASKDRHWTVASDKQKDLKISAFGPWGHCHYNASLVNEKLCKPSDNNWCKKLEDDSVCGWLHGVKASTLVGGVNAVAAVLLVMAAIWAKDRADAQRLMVAVKCGAALCATVASAFIFIACIVWHYNVEPIIADEVIAKTGAVVTMGTAFYVTNTGAFLMFTAAIFISVDIMGWN